MSTDDSEADLTPEMWAILESTVEEHRRQHEERFAPAESRDDAVLHAAMDEVEAHALEIITTGKLPHGLEDRLTEFDLGAAPEEKVARLFGINLVQHRLEFDVAWEVVSRLRDVERRIGQLTAAFALLLRAEPSETAIKYFRKAAVLFLAGYESEVAVMCGAVLETALATRFDDALRSSGVRPAFPRTGDYSIAQRMKYEGQFPVLSESERNAFWQVIAWRNDAVHVQPDLAPPPVRPILFTALLLPLILPRQIPL